ncbi:GntR family transcriptional regulator [Parasporobacterium paucivorans]|uniref:DNA-binding transcriptional regulator YhcF, GntR family n=1 Tax=Parasporobacterium paucivorans DSM 15970 TaxID=1122934 RepID=A0A1M6LPH7_9FIRM|nr:GntR family transcriptional regulator [Parasporobacterium paucivorans]SHJ72982.1 DNA-binding transcriptional regulator YhcF, GntR family [Parasporobacterium paucivorans DSM 15970]
MVWDLKSDRPIYIQLLEQIQIKIISGELSPGSKLPSVRDLAAEAAVNPNTMQKAMTELERLGLVYSQRTAGRYITEDRQMIEGLKKNIAQEQINAFLLSMNRLGFGKREVLDMICDLKDERDEEAEDGR